MPVKGAVHGIEKCRIAVAATKRLMSAYGYKQTLKAVWFMSAFGGKADIGRNGSIDAHV